MEKTILLSLVFQIATFGVFAEFNLPQNDSSHQIPEIRSICNCGQQNLATRIMGGMQARANEFPWRCFVRMGSLFCGCSLISDEWILTAAHCTYGQTSALVTLGAHDRYNESQGETITAARIINHPFYRHSHNSPPNDISLIKLSRPVKLSRTISSVCLPWKYPRDEFGRQQVVASGWGRVEGYQRPTFLQKVLLTVWGHQECVRKWGADLIDNSMICANQWRKGICQGDSGGSIDMLRNGRYYAVGVTSWAEAGCAGTYPSVFARVTRFLNWIRQETAGEDFCEQ